MAGRNCIVLGAQWGDEGKGKLTDLLARDAQLVVRFQGGANAGHTIRRGQRELVLHQVPSGVLNPDCLNLVGNGCVADPLLLLEELEGLRAGGIALGPERLLISPQTHIVTPIHRRLDALHGAGIGTTGRGIGPCYADKASRIGLRWQCLRDGSLSERYGQLLARHQPELERLAPGSVAQLQDALIPLQAAAEQLAPHIQDLRPSIQRALLLGWNILYEGAQGAMLDIDHGSYPFVTSSSTTIGGAYSGGGVYLPFQTRLAVVKAYSTRVGNGPFPTELHGQLGERLRAVGREFGATTGRPRRCGWLDLPLLRQAFTVNGFNGIALTKIDCLSGLDRIQVAVDRDALGEPVYEQLPGWREDISEVERLEQLPDACRSYLQFITEQLGTPLALISTGPAMHQTLILEVPW